MKPYILLYPLIMLVMMISVFFSCSSDNPPPVPEHTSSQSTAAPTLQTTEQTSPESNIFTTSAETTALPVITTSPITSVVFQTTSPPPETTAPPITTAPIEQTRPVPTVYPVPYSNAVDDSYFLDAVFIGDSRTQGMMLYGGVKSTYYADTGLNVASAMTKKFINENGDSLTVIEALKKHPEFKKVYVSLGVNEFWMSVSEYSSYYNTLLKEIIEAAPTAKIYIQTIFPLSADPTGAQGLNNEKMLQFNMEILKLAQKYRLFLVNMWEAFDNGNGKFELTPDITWDGVHLNTEGVKIQVSYIKTHT